MKISVIVPVYNMAADQKLNYCLDSLLAQTVRDMEIIAVDDCSSDESYEILKSYEQQHPEHFRALVCDRNRHQGGAKNLALTKARGEWISFIDADDWVVPDYYERLLAAAQETGADLVGCDYSLVTEHTMTPGQVVHNNRPEQAGELDADKIRSLMIDTGSLCVKLFRRELILDHETRFPEDIFYEDNAVARTFLIRAHRFAYLQEPLYFYYQHNASTVHTVTLQRLKDRVSAGRILLEEAREHGYLEPYRPEIEYSFTRLFYVNTLFSAMRDYHGPGKYRFVTDLGKEMKQTFPDFARNPYYQEKLTEEEKKMIRLQMSCPPLFYLYYLALWKYRDLRYHTSV
ncbi:MAG: glycosyltransferase [Lachnospiraceae bacterium]|nr:glycosyltransferase [Lachnospiraceae bacterium]